MEIKYQTPRSLALAGFFAALLAGSIPMILAAALLLAAVLGVWFLSM